MAKAVSGIPRDLQSDMHDLIDELGERVAREEMVNVAFAPSGPDIRDFRSSLCICKRYSMKLNDGAVKYWNEMDPHCPYTHPVPLADEFTIRPAV